MLLLAACGTPAPQPFTPQIVEVYATSAAKPWLQNVYACAPANTVVSLSDPGSADLTIRLGQPQGLQTPAFQIGSDEILVIAHPGVGLSSVSPQQVRDLFSGRFLSWKEAGGSDLSVQVWAFDSGEDIQQFFNQIDMGGELITSQARLATSAQDMSDAVGQNPGAIGILTRRWKTDSSLALYGGVFVPVLAIAKSPPQGVEKDLLACLQK